MELALINFHAGDQKIGTEPLLEQIQFFLLFSIRQNGKPVRFAVEKCSVLPSKKLLPPQLRRVFSFAGGDHWWHLLGSLPSRPVSKPRLVPRNNKEVLYSSGAQFVSGSQISAACCKLLQNATQEHRIRFVVLFKF